MSIAIPQPDGCGAAHSRPVTHGAPARIWELTCAPCESYLRGDRKPKILKHKIESGRVVAQERVPDADPMWSSTPETAPLSPDEEKTRHLRVERGEQQLRALEALVNLKTGGIDLLSRPDVMYYLKESGLPAEMLQGKTVCPSGHDNPAGNAFCGSCGASMTHQQALEPGGSEEPAVDLGRLHVQSLRKMCRDKGLPDKGSKDDLISRLQAAERVAA